ncbi:unnamed protein product, partial [Effrenium voratum]
MRAWDFALGDAVETLSGAEGRVLLVESGEVLLREASTGRMARAKTSELFRPGARQALATHRAVLGLGPAAGPQEATRAFRRLAKQHHPDKGGDPETFRSLHDAFQALTSQPRLRVDTRCALHTSQAVAWRYLRLPRAAVPTAGEVLAATKYALSGKEVLITGACNGIGLALALALLECPVKKLYLHGRCKERVAEVVARLPKAQRQKCCAAVADLSSLKEVDDLVATFTAPPDVIICCAGIATLPRWTASRD